MVVGFGAGPRMVRDGNTKGADQSAGTGCPRSAAEEQLQRLSDCNSIIQELSYGSSRALKYGPLIWR